MRWTAKDTAERCEDLLWMATTGETLEGAAYRLGLSARGLEKWCHNNGMGHLLPILRGNGWGHVRQGRRPSWAQSLT